jgi:hypothetical protein
MKIQDGGENIYKAILVAQPENDCFYGFLQVF